MNGDADARPQEPTSTLLLGTRTRRDRPQMSWATLLLLDPEGRRSAVVHIPALTATEVPGRGPHSLAEAYATGGPSLVALATENMLGTRVDRHVELSERDASVLFRALEPVEVDVPGEVRIPHGDGTDLVFEPGTQTLDADALVAYAYRVGEENDPESLGPRHLALWSSLVTRGAADPEGVRRALDDASGALHSSTDAPDRVVAFLGAFLTEGPRPGLRSLPVSPLEAPGDPLYVTDRDELAGFVEDAVSPELLLGEATRVQILNGNGMPGVGARVARRLVGNGFRVALTGNARDLNHRTTLIITYDPTREGRDEAARARELLGVGEVQVSLQEQGIVDLTIVVGRDFLRAQ